MQTKSDGRMGKISMYFSFEWAPLGRIQRQAHLQTVEVLILCQMHKSGRYQEIIYLLYICMCDGVHMSTMFEAAQVSFI